MQRVITSFFFLTVMLMGSATSSALEVRFYRNSVGNVVAGTASVIGSKTGTLSSGCLALTDTAGVAKTYGSLIEISDLGGRARACVINGATTDEVRLMTAKIKVLAATRVVVEIRTSAGELPNAAITGSYSFAAALKNVASFSSANAPKTANGILEHVKANGNDINQSGSVSVACGATSSGALTWTSSSSCTRTENESLSLTAGSAITHISRYELSTTATNDFFTFPASGHAAISKIKDVDGGRLENCIAIGLNDCTEQYPFTTVYNFAWRSPLEGSRGSIQNNITANGDLLQAVLLDSELPLKCRSVVSNNIEEDDKCSIAVATNARWEEIAVLKAKWNFTEGNCAKSWRFMMELADFRRFYFDNGKTFDSTLPDGGGYKDCTGTSTFSDVDIADKQNKAPNFDLSEVGGSTNDNYTKSLGLVGKQTLRQIAIMLDPHPDDVTNQSVDLFNLVVNNQTIKPVTSVEFAPVPTDQLPLQGIAFRITKEGEPFCVKTVSQETGEVRIIGGKYEAHIDGASLCGPGTYKFRVHVNDSPLPIPGETSVALN
jgi:hypothetical protein